MDLVGNDVDILHEEIKYLGPVWYSFMSCCELFFFCKHLFPKQLHGRAVFPFLSQRHDEKSSLLHLSHFSLSIMHEVVGEAILPNTFSKTAQLHLESCS